MCICVCVHVRFHSASLKEIVHVGIHGSHLKLVQKYFVDNTIN